jgi:chromate transporter
MSDAKADPAVGGTVEASNRPVQVSISQIFLEFLTIGATSFGGAVPYLRGDLVTKRHWLSEKEFVEMLSLSQSLPGLNVTNMAILVGQKLGGAPGSIAAILGVCLPGAVIMLVAGILYRIHGGRLWATAALKGVAAAAVGLVLATVVGLSQKSLAGKFDFVFTALAVIGVNSLHQSVPRTLIAVGVLSILWHHPRKQRSEGAAP